MARRNHPHFNVRPRYTSGSPAMVPEHTAERVAQQEQRAHGYAALGRDGSHRQRLAADEFALYGIAYSLTETAKGWRYHDLITGEDCLVPFWQWRIEDALIRRGHLPSVARTAAERIWHALPKRSRRSTPCELDAIETFEKSHAHYQSLGFVEPDKCFENAVVEAVKSCER